MADTLSTNSGPVLDMATFEMLKTMLAEEFESLLQEFLEETPGKLAELRQAVAVVDAQAVSRIAHVIKGTSGNLGISALSACCEALEADARNGYLDEAGQQLAQTEAEFARAREALTEYLAK